MIELFVQGYFKGQEVVNFYDEAFSQVILHTVQTRRIVINFCRLRFIEPDGIVTLSNLIRLFKSDGLEVIFKIPEDYSENPCSYKVINYLDDSLFFKKNFGCKIHSFSSHRNSTNGIEFLSSKAFKQSYLDNTIEWLKTNVSLRDKSFGQLETALAEIFNNIIDHSESLVGGTVFAQHYPNVSRIKLSVSDFGIGIPTSIRKKYNIQDDAEAISYAMKPSITTKSVPQNRGMGLDNLVHIVKNNGGSLLISSNKGHFSYGTQTTQHYCLDKNYRGTLIVLVFRTDTLEPEEKEEFRWY